MGDQNLKEVLSETLVETKDTTKTPIEPTSKDKSDQEEGETKSDETPDYESGIDMSDISEQDRPKFREKFAIKAKLLEKGYQEKFKEVASLKKAQEDLQKLGLSVDKVKEIIVEHLEKNQKPTVATTQKKEASKLLDQLIDNSPTDQRKSLEQLRQIVLEETDTATLKEQVNALQKELNSVKGYTQDSRKAKIELDLISLQDKYGKDFITKWKDTLVSKALEHNVPLTKVMQVEIPFEELEEAILATSKPKPKGKELTPEKKSAISSKGSGVTSSSEMVDTKKDWKSFLSDVVKK